MTSRIAPNFHRIKAVMLTNERVAKVMCMSREHVSRVFAGKHPEPPIASVIAQIIERCPPMLWPDEWRNLQDD